jgi:hypothetical protein
VITVADLREPNRVPSEVEPAGLKVERYTVFPVTARVRTAEPLTEVE